MIQTPLKRKVWWGGVHIRWQTWTGGGVGGPKSVVTSVGSWGQRHWIVKSPRFRRLRVHCGPTATPFGKRCIEISGICVLILKLTSLGALATQYVRPFLLISPLSTILADVSSQFSTLPQCNMIVLAARLIETLFGRQIALLMRKKMVKENLLGAKVECF